MHRKRMVSSSNDPKLPVPARDQGGNCVLACERCGAPVKDLWLSPKRAHAVLGPDTPSPKTYATYRMQGTGPEYSFAFGRPLYRLSTLLKFLTDGIVNNTRQAREVRSRSKMAGSQL